MYVRMHACHACTYVWHACMHGATTPSIRRWVGKNARAILESSTRTAWLNLGVDVVNGVAGLNLGDLVVK